MLTTTKIKPTIRFLLLTLIISAVTLIFLNPISTLSAPPPPSPNPAKFAQCANKNPTAGACDWIGSILQASNSSYFEGMSVPQRIFDGGFGNGAHTIAFSYSYTKGGIHAYDFITGKNQGNGSFTPGITTFNDCQGLTGANLTSCTALIGTLGTLVPIPSDSFDSKDSAPGTGAGSSQTAKETAYGARSISVYNQGTISLTSISAITHNVAADGDTGDSDATLTLNFTLAGCPSGPGDPGCDILIYFDGHLAVGGTDNTTGVNWGPGKGSSNISGGPYHIKDVNLDGGGGSLDNQIKGADILVSPDSPTVTTAIHNDGNHTTDVQNTTIALGSTIHDRATVDNTGGANGTPTGTATFQFFNNGDCSGNPADTSGALTLSSGAVDATGFSKGPLGSGSYSFKAHYTSSDTTKWNSADGLCEHVTVNKSQLAMESKVHNTSHVDKTNSSVPLGSIMHDTAKITGGAVGGFTPSAITFKFYTNNECSGDGTSVTNTGDDEGDATRDRSAASAALGAGSYSYKAFVAGDNNYLGTDSDCEPFTVDKAQLTVTTNVHDAGHADITSGNVPLGSVLHDTATVTGGVGGFTVPTPTFTLTTNYNGDTCDQGDAVANDGTESGATKSADSATLGAGTYAYRASVAGNDNYIGDDSDCEPFTVNQGTLILSTTVHTDNPDEALVGNASLGASLHDSASVGGINADFAPANPVTFKFYNNSDCSGEGTSAGSHAIDTGTGIAHPSDSQGPLAAGPHAFRAFYDGSTDPNYGPDSLKSGCEPFTVDKADTTATTHVHNASHQDITNTAVSLGSKVHDNASVGDQVGSFVITGDITYHFYTNGNCPDESFSDETVAVGSESSETSALGAGDYAYLAEYSGDNNYKGSTGKCEPFSVDKSQLEMESKVHDSDHNVVTSAPLGSIAHDTSKLTGGVVDGFTPPSITFKFYTSGTCDGNGTSVNNAGADGGDATRDRSDASSSLGAGSYSYRAFVAGDNNYLGTDSGCEPLEVNQATPQIVTEIHDVSEAMVTSVSLGTTVHDKATVTGIGATGFEPSGNVAFTFYNNEDCKEEGSAAGTVALDGADPGTAHPSDPEGPLAAGSYSFQAHYVGDDNYKEATSDCEPLTVNKARLTVETIIHNASHDPVTSVPLGSVVHDTATVTGGVDGFATPGVSFTFTSNYTNDCSQGTPVSNDGTDPGNGGVKSADSAALAAGDYAYRASAASDENYIGDDSDCEPLAVNRSDTSTVTEVHDSNHNDITGKSVPLGSIVHDSATVETQVDSIAITGTVNYRFYTDGNCEGNFTVKSPVNVGDESSLTSALAAGSYSYLAEYSGDGNYNSSTGKCEPFSVDKSQLKMESKAHDSSHNDITNSSVALGSVVHDTAKVTGGVVGGFTPPAITFKFYSNGNCSDGSDVSNTGADGGDASRDRSAASSALGAGSYSYKAFVADDNNYLGTDSGCEPFTVNQAQLTVTSHVHDSNDTNITNSSVVAGSIVHDQASVSGGVGGFATPTITFTFFTNGTCTPTGSAVNNIGTDSGGSRSADSSPLTVGNYSYKASIAGNDNYVGDDSDCEPFSVTQPATRTLGFWQTHTAYTTSVFNAAPLSGSMLIGNGGSHKGPVDTIGKIFGAFYSSIPKKTDGSKRTDLDKARMQLLQQLVAAKLNCAAFGCSAATTSIIATADAVYASGPASAILASASALDAYNNSGDSVPVGGTGSATPGTSQSLADKGFWNAP